MSRPRSRVVLRHAGAYLLAALFLVPVAFMIVGSLRPPGLPPAGGFRWVVGAVSWSNYRIAAGLVPLIDQTINSLIVVAVAVPVTVVVASWAGYAIAAARPAVRRALVIVSVVALMIPVTVLWVPRFVLFRWLNLTDTFVPLMAPALMATTPFYVLLFALVYVRIPGYLFEAARLEGLSPFQVWRVVAWPLGRAATFAVAILAFTFYWSDLIGPLVYLSDPGLFTLPLGLRALQTLEPTNHPLMLAAAVVATAPAVIAFLLAQRALFSETLDVR